nr:glycosyltransferase family 8 protein [Selenomonas bovis]
MPGRGLQVSGNINIVFACDSNYAQHATVAMMSILKNTVDPTRIVFYLLDDQIDLSVKRKMRTSIEQAHAAIHFCEVAADQFASFFVSGQLSRAAYFRLEMGHLLPSTVERVIYLDCDLLVLDDIAALWDHDMGGHPLAAVMDLGIMASSKDWRGKQERLGFSKRDRYFNSGVLMVDLAAWRAHDYGRQAEQLAAKNAYRHHDQDALNALFHRNWQPLPLRWNVIPPVWYLFFKILRRRDFRRLAIEARQHISILHYAGGYKPWEYDVYTAFNAKYYEYLRQTAFRDAAMPQPDPRRRGRSIARQLRRLKLADFWQRFFTVF